MTTFTLHRGIAIGTAHANEVAASIEASGMSGSEGKWKFGIPDIVDVRRRLESLYGDPNVTCDDVLGSAQFKGLCAGESAGATYYASSHNFSATSDHPLVIEFEADIGDIYVDCRDFLCAAFQLWDRESDRYRDWQVQTLVELFGSEIECYFRTAAGTMSQSLRIAMCNLASFDPKVIEAHYAIEK